MESSYLSVQQRLVDKDGSSFSVYVEEVSSWILIYDGISNFRIDISWFISIRCTGCHNKGICKITGNETCKNRFHPH